MSSDSSHKGVVQIKNVFKSFREGRDVVLRGASIDFPVGKLTYILGPSGTGKSVLIKHILGLIQPDQGEVWVEGVDLSTLKPAPLNELRNCFGMLFQNSALFDDFSVFENVAFPLREHTQLTETEIEKKVKGALTLLGMTSGFDKLPNELSGGMRKRVGLARAIMREPSILLYDEPTTGLDPVTRTTVDDLIETLKRTLSVTSIVISHDIPSALMLADHIAFLAQGQFVFQGTPDQFRTCEHPKVQEFLRAEKRSVSALEGRTHG